MSAIDYKRSFHDAVRCLCEVAKAIGIPEDEAAKLAGPDNLIARVRELREMAASDAEVATKYQAAATAIRASLSQFCDESLPYDRMIVDAAQKAADALAVSEKVDTRKPCTCGSIQACGIVKGYGRLGDGWRCVAGLENAPDPCAQLTPAVKEFRA